jgi:hypothetical protein
MFRENKHLAKQSIKGEATVKKTIIALTAAAFVGGALAPTPAAAFIPFPLLYPIFQAKKNENFKAVNPYEKKGAKYAKKKM